jgi:hypothetical protein
VAVLALRFIFLFLFFGCLTSLMEGVFSTGASSLTVDVVLALRFSLFLDSGLWKCIVRAKTRATYT